jgi:D-3-phosphoglycerate dehydrogenase
MGEHGVNIANFTLGRAEQGGDAIALLYVDSAIPEPILGKLTETGLFQSVQPLEFDTN